MSVILRVDGQYFGGWQSVRINRGIEQIAGTFDLTVTDRWNAGDVQQALELAAGQSCEVLVNDSVVITGFIDSVKRQYDKQSHAITITGRDKTGDLVDCSAIFKSGQWSNKTVAQIARDLLKPFAIGVIVATDVGAPLPTFAIQEGASVFEELERAAKMRALILMSDGAGNLLITRASKTPAAAQLLEGDNILKADGEFSWMDRFSQYLIKGQSKGSDNVFGEAVAQQSALVKDSGINRYRPLLIVADEQGGGATLKQRAEWERNVRFGRGTRATMTVQGWDVGGQLWQPNTLARVVSPLLSADLDLLIVSVAFSLDEGGHLTTLQLTLPQAFDTIENVKQTRLEKKIRKAQGDESGITDKEWTLPRD